MKSILKQAFLNKIFIVLKLNFLVSLSLSFPLVSFSNNCLKLFDQKNTVPQIQELRDLSEKLPVTEEYIWNKVLSGEDVQIINLNVVRENYKALKEAFPYAEIHTAVKALSTQERFLGEKEESNLLSILNNLGSHFETATVEEVRALIDEGVSPEKILFTHPDKDVLEIKESYEKGLRAFVSDSFSDLQMLGQHAPQSQVLIRLEGLVHNANDGIGERFGVNAEKASQLLRVARRWNLKPVGLSFHVGTHSQSPKDWETNIRVAGRIFKDLKEEGIELSVLDIGGGYPALNDKKIPPYAHYGEVIKSYIDKYFRGISLEKIIIEPGRGISGMSGVTIGRVINTKYLNSDYLVTVSTGRYSAGLIGFGNTINFYRKNEKGLIQKINNSCQPGQVYGKACASIDILHNQKTTLIPGGLRSGDLIVISGTGAYAPDIASSRWCRRPSPTRIVFDSAKPNFTVTIIPPPSEKNFYVCHGHGLSPEIDQIKD